MIKIDITDVESNEIMAVQQHYYSAILFEKNNEAYYSPDMTKCLYLSWRTDVPSGPSTYNAKICQLQNGKIGQTLKSFRRFFLFDRTFLSPGRYGNNYDHWSGNPWSNDSRYLSMIEIEDKAEKYKLSILDADNMVFKEVMHHARYLGNHMWSPNNQYYLFRSYQAWHLFSLATDTVRTVSKVKTFPKHCYFDGSEQFLIYLDDQMVVKVLNANSLELEADRSIRHSLSEDEQIDFSIWDPFKKRVVLGLNFVTFEGKYARCKRWIALNLTQ